MAERPKISRISIPGLGRLNAALNNWANWIEYGANLRGRWPVMVSRTPTGNLISIDGSPANLRIMFVTDTITAASGSTAGIGMAVDAIFTESTRDLSEGDNDEEYVYNYHAKGFEIGAVIAAFPRYGVLWVFDVDACAHYQ